MNKYSRLLQKLDNTACNNNDIFGNTDNIHIIIYKNNEKYDHLFHSTYFTTKHEKVHSLLRKEFIFDKKTVVRKYILIDDKAETLPDLLNIIDKHKYDPLNDYNINLLNLHNIKPYLIQLNDIVGNNELKDRILEQLLYFLQDFHKTKECQGDYMHTVIYGPPGTGKTEIAKILGNVYCKLGVLEKGTFTKATRSDLIAGYLGQTAIKTRDVINSSLGGVLFIDEAYALGNGEKQDSFSKECIDTLCESLSHHKDNLMVIVAGYETELNDCFFNVNKGLNSRFNWRFKTEECSAENLQKIYLKKCKDIGWDNDSIENSELSKWFKKNRDEFTYFGRDIETLLTKIKISHSKRVFGKDKSLHKKISIDDLNNGFDIFLKGKSPKNHFRKDLLNSLYC